MKQAYPSHSVMKYRWPWMVLAGSLMVILLFEGLSTSFVSAGLDFIQINLLLNWSRFILLDIIFGIGEQNRFCSFGL